MLLQKRGKLKKVSHQLYKSENKVAKLETSV